MIARIPRALAAAIIGGLAGAALLVFAYILRPSIRLDFDGEAPPVVSGVYPPEREASGLTFAWTRERVALSLSGLNRDAQWDVRIRYRGARPDPRTLPDVTFEVDGKPALRRKATNAFDEARVILPALSGEFDGATITIAVEPAFTPGGTDARVLGIVIDYITVTPATRIVLPPRRAIASATLGAAALGAGIGLLGVTPGAAIGSAIVVGTAQAVPISFGIGPYTPYVMRAAALAVWIAAVMALVGLSLEQLRRKALRNTARFVIALSAGAVYLNLLVLLHPHMPVVDARFQAHRFEWVLSGRYFFTQPMPGGVQFPYAIALYLFAAPWAAFTRDYVTLLRIVVCVSHAAAGALLYPIIVRTRGDRLAGAAAVLLFHLMPLPFVVIGNGNLTYAFGQSAALATIAAAILLPAGRNLLPVVGLFGLASIGLLSHVGVAPLLFAALICIAVFYRSAGDAPTRATARPVLLAAVVAALFSVVIYYGHFADAYRTLAKVRALPAAAAEQPATEMGSISLAARAVRAAVLAVRALGWPILILSGLGLWRLRKDGARDRLTLGLSGLGAACLAFALFRVVAPVDRPFQRYADEFIDRVNYAAIPLMAVLGALGASWAWRSRPSRRIALVGLLSAAAWAATRSWLGWIR